MTATVAPPRVRWITRAQWGALPATGGTFRRDQIVGITEHHSTGATLRPTNGDYYAWVREIQKFHMLGGLGEKYVDIAYNALYDSNGNIFEGRANGVVGAHALSTGNVANRITLGLCFLGNGDDTLTPAAQAARRAYYYVTAQLVHHQPLRWGHRDWAGAGGISTHCPGNWIEWTLPR